MQKSKKVSYLEIIKEIPESLTEVAKSSMRKSIDVLVKFPYIAPTFVRKDIDYAEQPNFIICGSVVCLPKPPILLSTFMGMGFGMGTTMLYTALYSYLTGSDLLQRVFENQNYDLAPTLIPLVPIISNALSGGYEYLRKRAIEKKQSRKGLS